MVVAREGTAGSGVWGWDLVGEVGGTREPAHFPPEARPFGARRGGGHLGEGGGGRGWFAPERDIVWAKAGGRGGLTATGGKGQFTGPTDPKEIAREQKKNQPDCLPGDF